MKAFLVFAPLQSKNRLLLVVSNRLVVVVEETVENPVEPASKRQKTSLASPPKFTKARLKKYFDKYKDEDDQVGPQGMLNLCEDALLDPEDVAMLVLGLYSNFLIFRAKRLLQRGKSVRSEWDTFRKKSSCKGSKL